jgi:hypothetical protein
MSACDLEEAELAVLRELERLARLAEEVVLELVSRHHHRRSNVVLCIRHTYVVV